ncbi:MAG: transglycosylase SLT domain-containing protein [Parcubacteria group bacterium]|nr:transglycosylase SLT domain-containing protein [Parcubacteria group bacterium]
MRHEEYSNDFELSPAERVHFGEVGERRRSSAEEEEFEKAKERVKKKREKEDTERRTKVRILQKELNKRDLSCTVPPPRGVTRPGEKQFTEDEELADTDEQRVMSRRKFLKKVAIGGTALLGAGIVGRMAGLFSGKEEKETRFDLPDGEYERRRFLMGVRAEGAFIAEDQETILDAGVMDTLKDYWKDVYTGEKKKKDENGREIQYDIAGAYGRMLKHDEDIKAEFTEQGVSPDLRFLSIVESNWNNFGEKYSWDRAGGPFQFMAKTATWLGLIIDPDLDLDERFIPKRSAQAAAEYLEWMLKGNGNDPRLALHEYNGSFALRYRLRKNKKNERPSYDDFLKHMSRSINTRRSVMKRFGEKRFSADLKEGWEGGVLGNYKENIEYMAKVMAVIELVNDSGWRKEHGFE